MKMKYTLILATVFAWGIGSSLFAADTTITIPDLECKGCATKVTNALAPIAGVAEVKTDVKARLAFVKPKPNMVLSPKALWEALEKAGKDPSKLEGPSGTFTSKPQS